VTARLLPLRQILSSLFHSWWGWGLFCLVVYGTVIGLFLRMTG
jgi:hypothetical protein